ncbi:MAG: metallophosphoesterase [Thermodesulfovibrionales bacterium]
MNTRYRNVRLLGLMFALILQLQLVACGGDSGTNNTDKNFPAVVFSDVHFNPFYDPSLFSKLVAADASEWANIFKTSSISAPSVWGGDTNYPLLVLALSSIKQNLGVSPLIIYTGDILGHNFPQTFFKLYGSQNPPSAADVAAMKAFTDKTVAFFMEQVRSSVGNIPVMFAVGNSDSYTGLGPDSSFLSDTAELYYTDFLNGTGDHQAFLNTFTRGGYYSVEPNGTNLMVIGLNTFEFSPFFGDTTSSAVAAELAWLDSTLASAQARGKKVWLLMHVPPGADKYSTAQSVDSNGHITSATMMWNQDYQTSFLQILSKYPGVITLTLAAHTHMDEYRILSSSDVLEITPSIAPYFGNNPAFKVFTFSHDTFKPTDYSSLNYDLATNPGQFNSYYTFSTAYSVRGLLNDSLAQLFPILVTSSAKQALYRGHYFSGHNYLIPVTNTFNPITDKNWPVYWCGIGNMGEPDIVACVNSY